MKHDDTAYYAGGLKMHGQLNLTTGRLEKVIQQAVEKQVATVFREAAQYNSVYIVLREWFFERGWMFTEQGDLWITQTRSGINGPCFNSYGEMIEFLLMDVEQVG